MIDGLAPRLRFDGFDVPYKKKKIRDFCSVKSGSTPLRSNKEYFRHGHIPWVKTTDLNNSLIIDTEEKVTDLALKETSLKVQPVGSVLVAMYGGFNQIGRTGLLKEPSATNQALAVLNPRKDEVHCAYLQHYLNAQISRWRRFAASSRKDPNITSFDVGSFPVLFCSLEEQNKITDFLTSVDKKISQLMEKKRLLKEYKKGVMQQIFSQNIRFKDEDGNAYPDWEEKPLSQLASKITTKNKGRLVKAVLTNSAKYGIISQQDYFEKDIAKGDNTDNYCVVDINDFVYNPRISELAPVGPIGRNKIERGVMSPLYSVFRFNSKVCLDFIEYFFKGTTWHKYMHSVANFGARHDRMNISSADLMALLCPYPCSDEQKKIARFLKTIDIKIEAVEEQIEQTQQFKKGLLQQMFV